MRLGIRAHDFGRRPEGELARRIADYGFSSVQLALNKAIAGPDFTTRDLTRERAEEIRNAFAEHGIAIAVLGCYINPIHPHRETRAHLFEWFKAHLRFARDCGCGVVALESGSVNHDYSPNPHNYSEEAFQELLRSLRTLLAEAERCNVMIGLEGVATHTVRDPGRMERVIDAVGSRHLAVVFDPVNFLTASNHTDQVRIMDESMTRFGNRIVAVHAKDFVIDGAELRTVPAGQGCLDYGHLLRCFARTLPATDLILEEANEPVCAGCITHLKHVAVQQGLEL